MGHIDLYLQRRHNMSLKGVLAAILCFTVLSVTPAHAATYTLDSARSSVGFKVEYLNALNISGRFNKFKGKLKWNTQTRLIDGLIGKITMKSLVSGDEKRDLWLLGQLNAKKKKSISFKSMGRAKLIEGHQVVGGILDMNGISNYVKIPFQVIEEATDEKGKSVFVLTADLELDRKLWGLGFNVGPKENPLISDTVQVSLQLLAKK
jgi:polyisoprenoid-binding protein YceI